MKYKRLSILPDWIPYNFSSGCSTTTHIYCNLWEVFEGVIDCSIFGSNLEVPVSHGINEYQFPHHAVNLSETTFKIHYPI